ncbi:MAG: membrane-bound lytic murein transglycosylase MltF, partial [Gammaproteobacteria bacterium]|nr:membrane-bound lytic murein transglycosylase MltF [Gammaproteobacteria bacterium]
MLKLFQYLLAVAVAILLLPGCVDRSPMLEQVKRDGTLTIITRNASTTYYEDHSGRPAGVEYELARLFADHLGVKLQVEVTHSLKDIFTKVARQEVHFAAAGLTVTEVRKNWVRFTPSIQAVTQQVVYKSGYKKPKSVSDLTNTHLEVVAHSSHSEHLANLKEFHPQLTWIENHKLENEELLDLVTKQLVDYAIIDSNELAINKHLYPEISVGFNISKPEPLAWAFPLSQDTSLYDEASQFISAIKKNGVLAEVLERNYSHIQQFDHVGTLTFLEHVQTRLPEYEEAFREAAKQNDLDWLLLAAIGYQESHWNANAVSPTGVKGLMMLTRHTADYLGVSNRRDPFQSIQGGAKYIRLMYERLPKSITDPDRMWMALASYNVGIGHLRDARKITAWRKGNLNKWVDVK